MPPKWQGFSVLNSGWQWQILYTKRPGELDVEFVVLNKREKRSEHKPDIYDLFKLIQLHSCSWIRRPDSFVPFNKSNQIQPNGDAKMTISEMTKLAEHLAAWIRINNTYKIYKSEIEIFQIPKMPEFESHRRR